ncbi:hypothetical protein HWD35_20640 [Tsukamurella tyrosinosolvens]|uniref:Uncharacterized protein n=1 Tax=Tsukamurella tyrosinosolvens TaxID=57704 RepID=A0A1H4P0P1_TSUTY|nr:hypothetical protein [Tsukamurella tyrosinosolvens]KXO97259.1 hypothetical protein AXK58_08500 [Tsukamurella tyrosinosolvens]KXP02784.1 hypothetical protein AXK59_20055 [Tsukamurella tyrosinosolvens]KZL96983.1 hypothetical protein AXX05_16015 [Tsukamurella tyrosinosolvens]MCA4997133.1 hypothetical protein [Tsukamurella tyrosinosolvens]MEC4615262.1 hypothetical protein [Tsukamurella tyrosinosolvens]
MTISRKTLAAAGFLAISAFALTPAIASAATPQMYDSCSATQEGQRITTPNGDTLECVEVDTGTGYDWEEPN